MYDTKKGVSSGKHGVNNATKTILCVVALSLLTIGCVQKESEQLSKEKEAAIADSIQTLAKNVNAAWERLDPESYMDYYSRDASFVYGGSMLSREELENLVEKYMTGLQESTITMVDSKVNVLDSDAAVISFRYNQSLVSASGDTTETTALISGVATRENGQWKIAHAHETAISD